MRSSTRVKAGSQVSVIESPIPKPVKGVYILIGAMFAEWCTSWIFIGWTSSKPEKN